jgi:hypothetical protein
MEGNRYEVRSTGWPKPGTTMRGSTKTAGAAWRWALGLLKAPGCMRAEIFDRELQQSIEVTT